MSPSHRLFHFRNENDFGQSRKRTMSVSSPWGFHLSADDTSNPENFEKHSTVLPLLGERAGVRANVSLLLATFLITGCASAEKKTTSRVEIVETGNRLRVEIGGKFFTEYHFKNVPRPFCYPILGPGERPMTRNWPMTPDPRVIQTGEEEQDHPHHRSLWFAHGNVNGVDFWSEQKNFGKQVHEKFLEIKSGKDVGVIKSENKWVSAEGKVICRDERTLKFSTVSPKKEGQGSEIKIIDFEIVLKATEGDVTLGDTKEGTMAIRLAETMRLAPNKFNKDKPTGHIVLSTGVREAETWGKRAAWCDYYGPVGGKTVGVAIFDHPKNPRHPTWWHVRDYGLFAANPFGVHDFEKKAKGEGDFTFSKSQSATFRYRFIFHEGDEKEAKIAELYEDYANGK